MNLRMAGALPPLTVFLRSFQRYCFNLLYLPQNIIRMRRRVVWREMWQIYKRTKSGKLKESNVEDPAVDGMINVKCISMEFCVKMQTGLIGF
jgi:hypothetical protein